MTETIPAHESDQPTDIGSPNEAFNTVLLRDAADAIPLPDDVENREAYVAAALETLVGIDPRDGIEGMLATQLLACHAAAMERYRRPRSYGSLGEASRLSRTCAGLIEALNRHRNRGPKEVTIRHVVRDARGGDVQEARGGSKRSQASARPAKRRGNGVLAKI